MRKKGLFLVIVLIISAAFIQNQIQKNEKCKIYEKILSDDPKNPAINLGILENDKILYYQIEEQYATFYMYDPLKDVKDFIGKIENYYLDVGSAILIDGNIYFFATVIEDDGLENVLFAINVDKKSIERYENNDLSLPGISIQQIGKKIISLKNKRINNEIITYLEIFDPEKETWEIVNEKRIQ